MSLKFEGFLDDISERQLEFIQDVLERRGFNNTKVIIDPVGKPGDNYAASIKRITISDNNGAFKMIAKIAPRNESVRHISNTHNIFKNEHHMYIDILPKFQELEAIADVPKEDRFKFAACYGSCIEAPHEVILLEDLQVSNHILLDRFQSLSDECVKSVLRNFAILHSLSFALKNKEPDTFKAMTKKLFDMLATSDGENKFLAHLVYLDKETEKLVEGAKRKSVVRGALAQSFSLAAKAIKYEANSKYSVIQHGDTWTNNFMFKFDGDNLKESILIDYQQSKENNPVCDVQYMIFGCTDYKTRQKHFHEWLDHYHSELDRCLSNFGLKSNYVYPREKFDADMKRYSKQIFGQSVMMATVLTMKPEDASRFTETMEMIMNGDDTSQGIQDLDYNHSILYINKVQELIDSYLEFGLL